MTARNKRPIWDAPFCRARVASHRSRSAPRSRDASRQSACVHSPPFIQALTFVFSLKAQDRTLPSQCVRDAPNSTRSERAMQGPTTVTCGAAPLRPCAVPHAQCARASSIRVRYDLWPHRVATHRSVQPARRADLSAGARSRVRVRVRVRGDCRRRARVDLCRGYYIPMDCRSQSGTLWLRTRKDIVARQIPSRASVNRRLCAIRDRRRRVAPHAG
jgi:hypothetical protein